MPRNLERLLLADRVWALWNAGDITDGLAAWAWSILWQYVAQQPRGATLVNNVIRKIAGLIAAIALMIPFALFVPWMEGKFQIILPFLSSKALRNIESLWAIASLILMIWLMIRTYKRIARPKKVTSETIDRVE